MLSCRSLPVIIILIITIPVTITISPVHALTLQIDFYSCVAELNPGRSNSPYLEALKAKQPVCFNCSNGDKVIITLREIKMECKH
jgi:hypothetical protein